ncbi:hypothetical protein B0H10DRAFT_2033903 [Mycena sp. CBHHK59/15]|nr:hypothetical protein B0H10DRAFT_2033903 [Mycena sp. CBHHK59/15]
MAAITSPSKPRLIPLVKNDFIIVPDMPHCSSCEPFKYRLWFTWCIVSMSTETRIIAEQAVEIWLAIVDGTNAAGDLWLWQEEDEESIRSFASSRFPAVALYNADWGKACQRRPQPLLAHLSSSTRMYLVCWFIIAGPMRQDHLRRGYPQSLSALIGVWAQSIRASWGFSPGNDYCETCGISQWLDIWIAVMLEVYSFDDLRSLLWPPICGLISS